MEIMHIKALILKSISIWEILSILLEYLMINMLMRCHCLIIVKTKQLIMNCWKKISNEAFFPISYGGGIESLKMIEKVISCGYERVIINSHQYKETGFGK